jgi:hypothetical protein
MQTKLTSAAFAAVMIASSAAWAQQSQPVPKAGEVGVEDEELPPIDSTQTTKPKAKKDTKSTTTKSKTTDSKSTKAKGTDGNSTHHEGGPDSAARKLNEDIVGPEQQKKNEAGARNPANEQPHPGQTQKTHKGAEDFGNSVGKTTTTAAVAVATATEDVTRATDHPGRYNPFAIEFNPLGLVVGGRLSFGFEWAPVTHHVIILSPHFVHTTAETDIGNGVTQDQKFTGVGGEIGYRYYTGHKGMNGVFVGPSVLGGVYNGALPAGSHTFVSGGLAVDVGVQEVVFNHLVLGAGIGIEYLKASHDFQDLPAGPWTIAQSGIKPRLLAQAGYAF